MNYRAIVSRVLEDECISTEEDLRAIALLLLSETQSASMAFAYREAFLAIRDGKRKKAHQLFVAAEKAAAA